MLSADELADLFEEAPCGYLRLQSDGRIDAANRAIHDWTGVAPGTLIGRRLRDLLTGAGRIFYETHFAPLLRMQGFFYEVALDLARPSGTPLQVLASASERRDLDGALVATRVVLFQATERRRYERGLVSASEASQAARAEAEEGLSLERQHAKLRDQFIAILGHDLRNPLAAISGAARLLSDEQPGERSQRIIGLLEQTVSRMSGLIDNVLDLARGQLGGGLTVTIEEAVELAPLLHQVALEVSVGTNRGIEAAVDLLGPVDCDPMRVSQLVSNLLGNALTHGDPAKPVRLSAGIFDGVLEIAVSNGGTAIDPVTLANLFQPFFRGGIRPSKQGLGLGLYIASEIANAHRGSLEVQSDPVLTRFTFRMPAVRQL